MILEPVDTAVIKKMAKFHNVEIKDRKELYSSYLWFLKHGGLFIRYTPDVTVQSIEPGQAFIVVFKMLDLQEKFPIDGTVVFFNKHGFGISFSDTEQMKVLKENIERNIMDFASKKEQTFTI